jgi:circadian clock protein KaiB
MKMINAYTGNIRRKKLKANGGRWDLRLYIAGNTKKAVTALRNLKNVCEEHLKCKYHIEVIDLSKNPELGREDHILAIPTLVRQSPLPVRLIIGDLSDTERVKTWLNL